MIQLTKNEALLIAKLLDMVGDKFGDHGCNDFRLSDHVDMTAEEKRELDKNVHECGGEPEEHDPNGGHDWQSDFCLMFYFSEKLEKAAETYGRLKELEQ